MEVVLGLVSGGIGASALSGFRPSMRLGTGLRVLSGCIGGVIGFELLHLLMLPSPSLRTLILIFLVSGLAGAGCAALLARLLARRR